MTEPVYFPDDPFGPVKPPPPVTSYTELIGGIKAQVEAMGLRQIDFDRLAGFPAGLSGKVFGMLQVKRLGPEKLFDALRAAGLRLRVEIDPEQLAKMKARIDHKLMHPRQANQARMNNDASPVGTHVMRRVFKHLSRLGGQARQKKMTKQQRTAHAKHAANSRWIAHRKRSKAAIKGAQQRKRNSQQQQRTDL